MAKQITYYTNNLSDERAKALSKPQILDLNRHIVKSEAANTTETTSADTHAAPPTSDQTLYLQSVRDYPYLMVTARGIHLGFGSKKNNKVRQELVEKGLIAEIVTNLGPLVRGTAKFAELTPEGYQALGQKPPRTRGYKGHRVHGFWQTQLHKSFERQGLKSEIEMHRNGKSVDVGVIQDGKLIAVEVGLTERNEAVNVINDLKAGFDEVIVAYRDPVVRNKVHRQLEGVLSKEQWEKVTEKFLWEFDFVKELVEANRGVRTEPRQRS